MQNTNTLSILGLTIKDLKTKILNLVLKAIFRSLNGKHEYSKRSIIDRFDCYSYRACNPTATNAKQRINIGSNSKEICQSNPRFTEVVSISVAC